MLKHYDAVPSHTRDAFEDYLIRGYPPGSFMMSVLTNDFIGACTKCDHTNSEALIHIAKWVLHNAPYGSWGSMQAVKNWIDDKDSIRTNFATAVEKEYMWEKLSQVI